VQRNGAKAAEYAQAWTRLHFAGRGGALVGRAILRGRLVDL